jgi:hypothetical protein
MPLRVFVSSSRELVEERDLAWKTIEELKLEPIMKELLPSSTSADAEEVHCDGVRLCNAYVGIIGTTSPLGSLQEFREASKLDKKCFMFVRKVGKREPTANELLQYAKKCRFAEYFTPQEFSSQLEESLLTFVAEETLRQLDERQYDESFVRAYLQDYVLPVLDEVREIEANLSGKRLVQLPRDAWSATSNNSSVGTNADLDHRIAEFYSSVRDLNDLRSAAMSEHRSNVASIMQETYLETAKPLNEYAAIERLLTESFEFFLTTRGDAHDELAKPLLDQLEEPVKSIAPQHWRTPFVSALWLVNKMLQRTMIGPNIGRKQASEYLAAFGVLHPGARRFRELLRRVCQGSSKSENSAKDMSMVHILISCKRQ